MSAIIETSSCSSFSVKSPQLSISKLVASPSINSALKSEGTQRFYSSKEKVSKRLNDIYLKSTERINSNQLRKSPQMLSENTSPIQQKTQRWSFENVEEEHHDDINGIESFLEKQGLLEVFNCFEQFRTTMIQSLSQEDASKSVKTKIELYHCIQNLKNDLASLSIKSQKEEKAVLEDSNSESHEQMNFLLSQISQLRALIETLKEKYNKIYHQFHNSSTSGNSHQTSLLDNSISFGDSSLQSLEHIDQDLRIDKVGNIHVPCNFGSKSTTISLESSIARDKFSCNRDKYTNILADVQSFKNSRAISEQSSYELEESCQHQTIQLCQCKKQGWISLISSSINVMKQMFRNQFQAVNLALAKSPNLHHLQKIISSYKSFNSSEPNQPEQAFMTHSQSLIDFILIHSTQLSHIVAHQLTLLKSRSKK